MTIDKDRLRHLAKAATPGPWKVDWGNWQIESENDDCYRDGICCFTPSDRDRVDGTPNPINPFDDAEFIAAANPETILALLDELEDLGNEYAIVCHWKHRVEQAEAKLERAVEALSFISCDGMDDGDFYAEAYVIEGTIAMANRARTCLAEISKMGEEGK